MWTSQTRHAAKRAFHLLYVIVDVITGCCYSLSLELLCLTGCFYLVTIRPPLYDPHAAAAFIAAAGCAGRRSCRGCCPSQCLGMMRLESDAAAAVGHEPSRSGRTAEAFGGWPRGRILLGGRGGGALEHPDDGGVMGRKLKKPLRQRHQHRKARAGR